MFSSLNFFKSSAFFWGLLLAIACLSCLLLVMSIIRYAGKDRAPKHSSKQSFFSKIKRKITQILAKFGYIPHDTLSRSFVKAISIMRTFFGSRNSPYQVPWYLMIGPANAGKKAILDSLNLDMPLGVTDLTAQDPDVPLEWRFYNHGIIIDLKSSLCMQNVNPEDSKWKLLLHLLANHRSKRPVDGVIITLPCKLFLGKVPEEELNAQAENLYMSLWQAQRILGLRFPIYILITQCDHIAGFKSFCKELPPEHRYSIFGWSSPYPIQASFEPSWVDNLFQEISSQLIYLQQEIFTEGKITTEADGVFVFGQEFLNLYNPLKTYLKRLFRPNTYYEGSFLRGIYFCGDSGEALNAKHSIYFTTDLFKTKIFPEKGVGRPTKQRFFAHAQSVKALQVCLLIAATASSVGLIHAYQQLRKTRAALLPVLNTVTAIIQRTFGAESNAPHLEQQAQGMLVTLDGLSVDNLFLWSVPPSWISSFRRNLEQVVHQAYNTIILKTLMNKLNTHARLIVEGKMPSDLVKHNLTKNPLDPLQTEDFQLVKEYVDRLYELQKIAIKMNNLPETGNVEDFALIIQNLFHYDLGSKFYNNAALYSSALEQTRISPFRFNDYKEAATNQLHKLYKNFLDHALKPEGLLPDLSNLAKILQKLPLERLSDPKPQLESVLEKLTRIITPFNSPAVRWLAQDSFNPGQPYEDFLHKTSACYFFGKESIGSILTSSQQAFAQLKAQLTQNYSAPLMGNFFSAAGDKILSSEKMLKVQGLLNLFFNEPFLKKVDFKSIQKNVPADSFLTWNFTKLQSAVSLTQDFARFITQKIILFPEPLRGSLQKTASNEFQKNIRALVAQAQNFLPQEKSLTYTAPEDVLLSEVQGLRAVSKVLIQLLDTLRSVGVVTVYEEIKQVLVNQCLSLLQRLDRILEDEGPYSMQIESFNQWKGEGLAALYAFGVYNLEELKNYVNLQRGRILYLAKEFAEPAVQVLTQAFGESRGPNLFVKWKNILTQLGLYNRKAHGNSLSLLEDCILSEFKKVNIRNCSLGLDEAVSSGNRGDDFFLQKRAALKQALTQQCKKVTINYTSKIYNSIAYFFNKRLAGHFPFGPVDQSTSDEVDWTIVTKFYKLLTQEGEGLAKLLAQLPNDSSNKADCIRFIENLESLRSILQPLLTAEAGQPPKPLFLNMTFRTNKNSEKNGNQLIYWSLDTGEKPYLAGNQPIQGQWVYGASIEATFRWAKGSYLRPYVPAGQSYAALITPWEVRLSYGGRWALLRFIAQHKASLDQALLRFDLPCFHREDDTEDKKMNTVVFMNVELLRQVKDDLQPFELPNFPHLAPILKIYK